MSNDGLVVSRQMLKGFSLIELMIVVVIIGVLAGIGYPTYRTHIESTRLSEVKGQILELSAALERYRAQRFSYNGAVVATIAPDLANNPFYDVQLSGIEASTGYQVYEVLVTPKALMTGTGALRYNSRGQKCHDKANDSTCNLTMTSSWD